MCCWWFCVEFSEINFVLEVIMKIKQKFANLKLLFLQHPLSHLSSKRERYLLIMFFYILLMSSFNFFAYFATAKEGKSHILLILIQAYNFKLVILVSVYLLSITFCRQKSSFTRVLRVRIILFFILKQEKEKHFNNIL